MYVYFHCYVSVAFPPFSLTEVIWICNFVLKRTLTLMCFAVRCRLCYHKRDRKNEVDVKMTFHSFRLKFISNGSVAFSCIKLALKLLRINFNDCKLIFSS